LYAGKLVTVHGEAAQVEVTPAGIELTVNEFTGGPFENKENSISATLLFNSCATTLVGG
jgi:hypothetical protein